jgi:hypothetical protein
MHCYEPGCQINGSNGYAYLAFSYAHLGQQAAAAEALARFRSLSQRAVDVYARSTLRDPHYLKLFLDGCPRGGEEPG